MFADDESLWRSFGGSAPAVLTSKTSRKSNRRQRAAKAYRRIADRREAATKSALSSFYRWLATAISSRVSKSSVEDVSLLIPDSASDRFASVMIPQWNRSIWSGIAFENSLLPTSSRQSPMIVVTQEIDADAAGLLDSPVPPKSITVSIGDAQMAAIKKYLKSRTAETWKFAGATVHKSLQSALKKAINDGATLDNMRRIVHEKVSGLSDYQAERIARTENTAAMNFGQHQMRVDAEIELKEWVSTRDARTRRDLYDHFAPNGQTVKNEKPFVLTGPYGSEKLMHPGDSSLGAGAGNIIHCRCTAVAAFED